MTSSKGLEFDVVLILGMEDNTVPHFGARNDPGQLQEERRKFYVSITRARDEVRSTTQGSPYGRAATVIIAGQAAF